MNTVAAPGIACAPVASSLKVNNSGPTEMLLIMLIQDIRLPTCNTLDSARVILNKHSQSLNHNAPCSNAVNYYTSNKRLLW